MDIRKADKSDIQEILRLIEDSYTPYRDSIKDIDIPESNLLTIRCKGCSDSFELGTEQIKNALKPSDFKA